jgi:hypothetical protein
MKIKNKIKRQQVFDKLKKQKSKDKSERRKAAVEKQTPVTIESKRLPDESISKSQQPTAEVDAAPVSLAQPRMLMTNSKTFKKTHFKLLNEFATIFNCKFVKRRILMKHGRIDYRHLAKLGFKYLLILNNDVEFLVIRIPIYKAEHDRKSEEDDNQSDPMLCDNNEQDDEQETLENNEEEQEEEQDLNSSDDGIIDPGLILKFKIITYKFIHKHNESIQQIQPELIINNFKTNLGIFVATELSKLFSRQPQFERRICLTLHNQRDFIFLRRHRYIFQSEEKVDIQELGPRVTLKLVMVREGVGKTDNCRFKWTSEMDKIRTRFYL